MDVQSSASLTSSAATATLKVASHTEPAVAAKPTVSPVEAESSVQQPVSVPSLGQVAQAVKSINKFLQDQGQNLEFTVDSDSQRTIVKVVDQGTKEVLRQIPSEETLEIARALDQATGLLVRDKA
jgi:flagellar protein FlaG